MTIKLESIWYPLYQYHIKSQLIWSTSLTCIFPCGRHRPCRRLWLPARWHRRRGEARGAASTPAMMNNIHSDSMLRSIMWWWLNLLIGWRGWDRVLCAGKSVHCRGGRVHPRKCKKVNSNSSFSPNPTCRMWRGEPPWCAWTRAPWWCAGSGGPACKPRGSMWPVAGSQSPHVGT